MPDTTVPEPVPIDPVAAVERLRGMDPDAISARLEEISREREALMLLLRATRAARRRQERSTAGVEA
jgi:hypothetical protein